MQTALLAGVGGLTLYNALKPNEQKTVIIHEGASPAPAPVAQGATAAPVLPASVAPANYAPPAPVAQGVPLAPAAVDASTVPPLANTAIPIGINAGPVQPMIGATDAGFSNPPSTESGSTSVPLAPVGSQPSVPLADAQTPIPLAPIAEGSTNVPVTTMTDSTSNVPTTMMMQSSSQPSAAIVAETTTGVPLATYPNGSGNTAPLKGAAPSISGFNLAFYACLAMTIAKLI